MRPSQLSPPAEVCQDTVDFISEHFKGVEGGLTKQKKMYQFSSLCISCFLQNLKIPTVAFITRFQKLRFVSQCMGSHLCRLNLLKIMKIRAKTLKALSAFQVENWYFAARYLLIFQKTLIMQIFDFGSKFFEKNF